MIHQTQTAHFVLQRIARYSPSSVNTRKNVPVPSCLDAASTASEHLHRLVESGLVTVHPQGRHRYYRLRDAEVASVIESLSRLAPAPKVRSLKEGNRLAVLRRARFPRASSMKCTAIRRPRGIAAFRQGRPAAA